MPKKIPYGEAFAHFAVEGYGRRGAPWYGINKGGVLVVMAHKIHFKHYIDGKPSRYVAQSSEGPQDQTTSSKHNAKIMQDYWEAGGRFLILMEGIFHDDGSSTKASVFSHWAGKAYEATLDSVTDDGNLFEATCRKALYA